MPFKLKCMRFNNKEIERSQFANFYQLDAVYKGICRSSGVIFVEFVTDGSTPIKPVNY